MAQLNSSLLAGNADAAVDVAIVSGAAGGHVDDAAFTAGADDISMSGGFFNDSTPDSVDEGDGGALRMSGNRVGYRTLRDAAGNERGQNVSAQNAAAIEGDVAHDAVDAGAPNKGGAKAISFGADPTEVAANDRTDLYASRAGVPWVLGGHPNILSREYVATTAQTDDAIVDSIGANDRVIVTEIEAVVDNAATVDVGVRIGFGSANVPSVPADGASVLGMVLTHPGIAAGSGVVRGSGAGILTVGGTGEELRITNEVPTTGSLRVIVSYFIITEA